MVVQAGPVEVDLAEAVLQLEVLLRLQLKVLPVAHLILETLQVVVEVPVKLEKLLAPMELIKVEMEATDYPHLLLAVQLHELAVEVEAVTITPAEEQVALEVEEARLLQQVSQVETELLTLVPVEELAAVIPLEVMVVRES
jgi:hypothetical protein